MPDYLLKANIILALLYAFYRLFFYRDTFFNCRRASLLGIIAVAALAPLPWMQLWIGTLPTASAVGTFTAEVLLPEFVVTAEKTGAGLSLMHLAALAYWTGVCLLAGRILVQLLAIIRLKRHCPRLEMNGLRVRALPEGEAPFSFFRQIFVCPTGHTSDELDEILAHEQTHVRQAHSIDVLVGELACTLCWFNPSFELWFALHLAAPSSFTADLSPYMNKLRESFPGFALTPEYFLTKGLNVDIRLFPRRAAADINARNYNAVARQATGIDASRISLLLEDVTAICGTADMSHNQRVRR